MISERCQQDEGTPPNLGYCTADRIIANDPPPTSQPTDNNPLTNLQDRQRAPKQQISRCLENGTRIDLSLSEISDEEVDYGSYASNVDLDIAPDSSWSAL